MARFDDIRILYMEDDPGTARLVQKRLEREGYMLDIARDGYEGLTMYAAGHYDLIVIDQNMPGLAGVEVIRMLAAQGSLPPTIMITGAGSEHVAVEAMKSGASDYLIKDIDGGYLDLLSIVIEQALQQREIVRQKHEAEEALRQSQALLHGILDYSPTSIYVQDLQGRFLLANQPSASSFQLPPWQMIGRTNIELGHIEIAQDWQATDQQILETGAPVESEHVVQLEDGVHVYLTIKFPLYNEQGQIYAIGGVSTDITERKHMEELLELRVRERTAQLEATSYQLQRHRDLLQTVFDSIHDGLLLIDREGYILAANQVMSALLGCAIDDLIDRSLASFCQPFPSDEPGSIAWFPALWVLDSLKDGLPRRQRERFSRNGTGTRVLDMQALPIHGVSRMSALEKRVDRVVLHVVDVTEQLQLEALMLENERFSANKRLTQIVAHEVNSPLQTILFSLDQLLRKTSAPEQQTFLRVAHEEIERVGKILHQLKDIYQVPADAPVTVDVNALIERVLLLTGSKLANHHIVIVRDLAMDLPPVRCHADQLMQVLLNLVLNAIDAMLDGGTLGLRTVRRNHEGRRMVLIEIADTGTGILEELQLRIFDPFFTTKEHGSGLGLSVSQKIITEAHGTLTVQSRPGNGTTFTIQLPVSGGKK